MRARCMDPVTGRFISEDKAKDGPNWYVYADDNPTNAIDPDGRSVTSVTAWLTGMVLAGAALAMVLSFKYSYATFPATGYKLARAQALATLATAAFAFSAFGSEHVRSDALELLGIELMGLQGVIAFMLSGASEGSRGLALAAVAAAFGYGLAVLGYVAAADIASLLGF